MASKKPEDSGSAPSRPPPPVVIKTEPGLLLAGGPSQRLSSIRAAPDLTLGGVQKKRFAPAAPSAQRPPAESMSVAAPSSTTAAAAAAASVPRTVVKEERRPAPASSAPALTPFSFGPAAEHRKISEMSGVSVHQLPGQQQQQLARGGPRKVDLADVGSIIDPHTYYPTVLPFTSQPPVPKEAKPSTDAAARRRRIVDDEEATTSAEAMDTEGAQSQPLELATGSAATSQAFLSAKAPPLGAQELMFVQLPNVLPVATDPPRPVPEGLQGYDDEHQVGTLRHASEGYLGKLRVHRSGRMTLRIGNIDYEVSNGMELPCHQQVMAVLPTERQCALLGDVSRRLVVTPDVSSLLASASLSAAPEKR